MIRHMTTTTQSFIGGGGSMARGTIKVTLDLFPCVDELGVRTGNYGTRLLVGSTIQQIPAEFQPVLVVGSVTGEVGSGSVEGSMFLKYGGTGEVPASCVDLQHKAVHALKWSGPGGTSIPMEFLIALADTMMPVELYSKRWTEAQVAAGGELPDPADPTHPYADADNDGVQNWRDLDQTDGPGWPVPDPELGDAAELPGGIPDAPADPAVDQPTSPEEA
jgi:hypothetical protein